MAQSTVYLDSQCRSRQRNLYLRTEGFQEWEERLVLARVGDPYCRHNGQRIWGLATFPKNGRCACL